MRYKEAKLMKNTSKGVITASTSNMIVIEKGSQFDDLKVNAVKADLEDAASSSNFNGDDGKLIDFIFVKGQDNGKLVFNMKNFAGVNFTDSFKTAPEERQNTFKAWSKFWSHLSKLGYSIK